MFSWYNIHMDTSIKEFNQHFHCNNFYFHYTSEQARSLAPYYKHFHSNYELYVFLEGDVEFIVENISYKMQPRTILLIPPYKYHYAKITHLNTNYKRFTFLFNPSCLPDNLKNFLDNDIKIFSWNIDDVALVKHSENILRSIKDFSEADTELFLSLFLCEILLNLKYSNTSIQLTTNHTINHSIDNILSFINEHIYEPLSLEYIAHGLFLTPVYVSQLFSKTMHISLMKYIKQKKLLIADSLIRNGTKATNAASLLGFSDYSTFFRLYKQEFGYAPSQHAQNHAFI